MRQLAGLGLFLAGFLLATSVTQNVYRWTHRDGYIADTVTIVGETKRRMRVQLASDHAIVSVRRDRLDSAPAVWYNRDARLVAGIVLFDERVIARNELPTGGVVAGHVLLTATLLILGLVLFFGRANATSARARRDRRRR